MTNKKNDQRDGAKEIYANYHRRLEAIKKKFYTELNKIEGELDKIEADAIRNKLNKL